MIILDLSISNSQNIVWKFIIDFKWIYFRVLSILESDNYLQQYLLIDSVVLRFNK